MSIESIVENSLQTLISSKENNNFQFITAPYVDEDTKELVTTVAYAVKDVSKVKGVVGIDIMLSDLNEMISKNIISENEIAEGNADLTQSLKRKSNDEVGELVDGFNKFVIKLQTIVSQIKGSKNTLSNVEQNLQIKVQEAQFHFRSCSFFKGNNRKL